MKKYPKMTFAALSAIVLNFSCLATSHPLKHPDREIGTHNNILYRNLTPLSTGEQILLLKNAILTGKASLAENIFTGHIGKIGQSHYYTPIGGNFFTRMSDQKFEELQLFSLNDLGRRYDNGPIDAKRNIFELITAKFYEVTNNKEQAYQTTASKVYHNLERLSADNLTALINLLPSPDNKRAFVRQLLNHTKQDNNINACKFIFLALDNLSRIRSIFRNQPWLQPFIREYLERALRSTNEHIDEMPMLFIKKAAPDLYNEKFFLFLKKCIIEDADTIIGILLPLDEDDIPSDVRRLSAEYLNLALEGCLGGDMISSHIASYTDTSSDLTDVVQTITSFTQEERQETLEGIKKANSDLYYLLSEALQRLGY